MTDGKFLIENTTREEREEIVRASLGVTDGLCDGCAGGLESMYDDYIEGRKELAQINASFRANYVRDEDETKPGCSYVR